MSSSSSAAISSVRSHADRLGLDRTHFTSRRWTESDLATAVRGSRSWAEVSRTLGLAGGSSAAALRDHAVRLGLDAAHLERPVTADAPPPSFEPDLRLLPRAASMLAAGWFTLCGHDVSWPLEPSRYDLVVALPAGLTRVQVKTASVRAPGTWVVWLSTTRRGRSTYSAAEVDAFFVIDGDLAYYLIPIERVAGLHAVHLSAYADCRVKDGADARQ
jgi:hypothetical protein